MNIFGYEEDQPKQRQLDRGELIRQVNIAKEALLKIAALLKLTGDPVAVESFAQSTAEQALKDMEDEYC